MSVDKKVMVNKCQRCGKSHKVIFRALKNPDDEYNYYGICINSNQPLLMKIVSDTTNEIDK